MLEQQKGFSVVLSDMCPPVSGITTRDSALSFELGMRALDLAVGGAALGNSDGGGALANSDGSFQVDENSDSSDVNGVLQKGGHLLIKLLESEDVRGACFSFSLSFFL